MILAINPTRMELLKLKKRIAIAIRGHKLLKDKQDELMRRFLLLIEKTKLLRGEVEGALKKIFIDFIRARSINSPVFIDKAITLQKRELEIATKKERVLNLEILNFEISNLPDIPIYSFYSTTSDLDSALINLRMTLPKMVELAELEIKIKAIAEEIKRTRRRVNALEYIFIPNLVDTAKFITMKLAELERSNLTRLMRVKELIEA